MTEFHSIAWRQWKPDCNGYARIESCGTFMGWMAGEIAYRAYTLNNWIFRENRESKW